MTNEQHLQVVADRHQQDSIRATLENLTKRARS